MKKLIRDTSTPEAEAFWTSVKKSAEAVRSAPAWMKAGIDLNERNFTTFGPDRSQLAEVPPPRSSKPNRG